MSAFDLDPVPAAGSSGRYYPIARLGRGGMSEVYLAIARGPAGFNKLVVIKRLLSNLAADPQFLEMFLDEARLTARLNHPNIVQTNEVGLSDGTYFIAMEYLDGQPLLKIVQRLLPRPLPVEVALCIAANVSAGLHYAHTLTNFDGTALGIVHRDVSPQNIFVTYSGQIKVVDFGIAKVAGQTTETAAGILKGKIAYMSPEQMGGGPIDGRADVFSLGVVLYEALTGRRMWGGPTRDVNIVKRLVTGDIPSSPRSVVPDLPEDVDRICQRALEADPRKRYASALEMHKDLEASIVRLPRRSSEREIGERIAAMFEQERQVTAKTIEKQLSLIDTSKEGAMRSLTAISVPVAAMLLDPVQDSSAAAVGRSRWPWRGLTMHQRRTLFVLAALGLLVCVIVWGYSGRGGPEQKSAFQPASARVQPPPTPSAIAAIVSTDTPTTDLTAEAGPGQTPARPAQPLAVRRAPASVSSHPSASGEMPAPPPRAVAVPTSVAAPTYGPLDDRH
jgi:serine/threonine protein kinase